MVWLQPRPDGDDVEWSAQASKLNFAVLNAPGQGVPLTIFVRVTKFPPHQDEGLGSSPTCSSVARWSP